MEVDEGLAKTYWAYSCMSRKVLKLISDRQKSIEIDHGQLLNEIMVKLAPLGWGGFKFENLWTWPNYMELYTRIIAIPL